MNVFCVVVISLTSLLVIASAVDDKAIQKRFLKLKNVHYNKTEKKPKSLNKKQKNKTLFVLSNPVIYPQKAYQATTTESVPVESKKSFDFLNFDAYILKPLVVNYTALLSQRPSDKQEKEIVVEHKPSEFTTAAPQFEVLDFGRAEPLIQTTTSIPYETTPTETTTPKISTDLPLGLAYFDSLRKYRKAFDTLRKAKNPKTPRPTSSELTHSTTTTTTEAPYIEPTTIREAEYVTTSTSNFDEDFYRYSEPYFESYRSRPRFESNDDYFYGNDKSRYETTNRYPEYEPVDDEDNHYEAAAESVTTNRPPNSKRRKLKKNGLHSPNVKSNFLYDRFINYPQESESRRVASVARLDDYNDLRRASNDTKAIPNGTGAGKKQPNTTEKPVTSRVPTQRHYFQYVNVVNDGTYNAGVGKGNQNHYIEQHELSVPKNGTFQKKVRWNDKRGGFGELYYDLNHHQKA